MEDYSHLSEEEAARMDAEDRANDPDNGINYDEIFADFEAEKRGEGPPSIRIQSPEHLTALLTQWTDEAVARVRGRNGRKN